MIEKDMKTLVYKQGEFIDTSSAGIDIFSQTVHYGFGAFEGIRSYLTNNGVKLFKAREHFDRLKSSCERVKMPFTWDIEELIEASYKLLEVNNLKNAYVRPLVVAGQGMDLKVHTTSEITIMAWDWDFYQGNQLLKTCMSAYERPSPKAFPVSAKVSGNYVNSILATADAAKNGYDDAIQLDARGFIAEAPGANLFIEKDGRIYTPEISEYILAGITRSTIIKIAKQLDIEVVEKNLSVAEFKNADSAFLCSTAAEVVGIGSVDEVKFSANFSDTLGGTLQKAYKNLVLDKLSFEVII
jgi:branched-chain amino acid aminotransferase